MEFLKINFAVRRILLFDGPLPDLPSRCEGERYWRLADPAETRDWIARRPPRPELRREYEIALSEQHWLFLAHDGNVPVGHRWVAFRRASLRWPFTCELNLGPDLGYFNDLFVAPSHRGRGIGVGGALAAVRQLQAAGIGRCAALVIASNRSSARLWRGLGVPSRLALHAVLPRFRRWFPPQPWLHAGIRVLPWTRPGDGDAAR